MNEEELYQKYQNALGRLEEKREDYERKRRCFDEYKEGIRAEMLQERADMELQLNAWGECEDSGEFRSAFEDMAEQEFQELEKQEESLQEEHRRICSEMSDCETWYQEEQRKSQEEEACQESRYTNPG